MKFYIDTAIEADIVAIIEKIDRECPKLLGKFGGITTNPNAMHNAGITTYGGHINQVKELVGVMSTWGLFTELHTQLPSSTMNVHGAGMFIDEMLTIYPPASIVIKFPPNIKLIADIQSRPEYGSLKINVTGLTSVYDCLIMLMFSTVRYASLIPGRMEAAGINASQHLALYETLMRSTAIDGDVITGSMRTVEQVISSANAGTLPTIGTKVWNLMTPDDLESLYNSLCPLSAMKKLSSDRLVPIPVSDVNVELTNSFFAQMDEMGKAVFDSFQKEKIRQIFGDA